jgi:hypothetical protein
LCITSFNCLQLVPNPSIFSAFAKKSSNCGLRRLEFGGPNAEEEERLSDEPRKEPEEGEARGVTGVGEEDREDGREEGGEGVGGALKDSGSKS